MTTTLTEKEIESIKSTYQSELEKYNSLKKEISSLLEIPNLEKWNGKVLNKRFCSFLTENSDWNVYRDSWGIYKMTSSKFIDRHPYSISFQNPTYTITDEENRIDIEKFKNKIQKHIDSIDSRIETLKNFDVELACQSANEIIRIQTQNKIPSLYMETYEQNPLVGRLFAVMEVQY